MPVTARYYWDSEGEGPGGLGPKGEDGGGGEEGRGVESRLRIPRRRFSNPAANI